ncbi:MAG TPA: hypothetical protein VLB46_15575 [Pyrinomonadaceae bacterium]|nr:hypothetical protein [Pyrinomonadaceae bacterium]
MRQKKFSDETDIYLMQEPIVETHSQLQIEFDPVRWAQRNPWLSEGQADDRIPMNGSVKDSGGTPSVQRAFARKSHQAMFKKWSQARRD